MINKKTKELLYRFFEPSFAKPKNFIICSIIWILWALNSISYARYFGNLTAAIQAKNTQDFYFWVVILGLTTVARFLVRLIDRKYIFGAATDADSYIYKKYITKFFLADNTKVEQIGTGRIISVLKSWITNRSYKLMEVYWMYMSIICTFIIWLWLIASKSLLFFYIAAAILTVIFIRIRYFWSKGVKRRMKIKEINTEQDRSIVKQIMSKFEILQSNKISSEIESYTKFNSISLSYRFKEKFRQSIGYDGSNLFVGLFRVAIIWLIGYGIFQNTSTLADFVMYGTLTGILIHTVSDLSTIWKWIADSFVHIEKLRNTFDNLKIEQKLTEWKEFEIKKWDITLKNISFSYNTSNNVLQDFDLHIEWGKRTALVGASWWGKTTIIKLAALYIRPEKWSVLVDGQDLSEIKLSSYYKHIWYLTQEPSVFDGTIYENLTYALDHSPEEKALDKVIRDAQCEFIYEFEHKLKTEIGEKWVRLSGGQKQRIAIAKIMLKNPNIILLDEPTSALDSFNEEKINIALTNLFKDKTVIVVAHRLQTVKQADRIILFENGKVIEDGNHEELVDLWWSYKKMLDLQSGF